MRVVLGAIAAVVVGALGGLILGEYELRGVMAIVAGVLFGLAVAEAAITAGKSSDWFLVVVAAAAAGAGLTWAAWIDAGNDFALIAGLRWVASAVAALSAGWWVRSLGSRSTSSPPPAESV